jgi:hypothetical protein
MGTLGAFLDPDSVPVPCQELTQVSHSWPGLTGEDEGSGLGGSSEGTLEFLWSATGPPKDSLELFHSAHRQIDDQEGQWQLQPKRLIQGEEAEVTEEISPS